MTIKCKGCDQPVSYDDVPKETWAALRGRASPLLLAFDHPCGFRVEIKGSSRARLADALLGVGQSWAGGIMEREDMISELNALAKKRPKTYMDRRQISFIKGWLENFEPHHYNWTP